MCIKYVDFFCCFVKKNAAFICVFVCVCVFIVAKNGTSIQAFPYMMPFLINNVSWMESNILWRHAIILQINKQ